MLKFILNKCKDPRILKRICQERLTEPVHLNLISFLVLLLGSFRQKVNYDLIIRQHHAYGLLKAADYAKSVGIKKIAAIEFGTANGAGLFNLVDIAKQVTLATGVEFSIIGFDSGKGMPPPIDYRDHPELYAQGDFPMEDGESLLAKLPKNAKIYFGDIAETIDVFKAENSDVIGFISIDVDYYWSTVEALKMLVWDDPKRYLSSVILYFDDVQFETQNPYCGELLAIEDFNSSREYRKITKVNFLQQTRIFTRARWLQQMFFCHILDHPMRSVEKNRSRQQVVLTNPYFN